MMCNKWPPNLFTTINLYFSIICLLGQLWLCFGLAGLDRVCVDWGVWFGSTWNRLREQSLSKACGSGRGWKDKKQKQTQVMPLLRTCTCHFLHMAQPRVNEWGSPLGEQGWEGLMLNISGCESTDKRAAPGSSRHMRDLIMTQSWAGFQAQWEGCASQQVGQPSPEPAVLWKWISPLRGLLFTFQHSALFHLHQALMWFFSGWLHK